MGVKRVIEQASHRNGVGGHPAVISLFTVDGIEGKDDDGKDIVFVATSLLPDLCAETLRPDAYSIGRYGEQAAYENQWLNRFAVDTVVLSIPETVKGNIAFGAGNSWRGADDFGPDLARAWREKQLSDTRYGGPYDPALEWYHVDHPETLAAQS